MIRSQKRALESLIARLASIAILIGLAALPASALSQGSPVAGSADSKAAVSFPGTETLCVGECSGLPPLVLPLAQPDPFDFELGLRVLEQGLDLRIASGGHVVLVGPVDATGRITLRAAQVVVFDAAIRGSDVSIELAAPRKGQDLLPDILELPGTIALPGDRDGPICGCITLQTPSGAGSVVLGAGGSLELRAGGGSENRERGSNLRLEGGGLVLAAQAVSGGASSSPPAIGSLSISRGGDVYVDLSGVTLRSLYVEAQGALVIASGDLAAVPEPGTALLLGFGLAALARGGRGSPR